MTTIVLASDHAGLDLKNILKGVLETRGYPVRDEGTHTADSVDYPDFAAKVARAVAAEPDTLGILVCGTGIGMSMSANKIRGARAALCHTEYEARMCRQHNQANILCLGSRVLGVDAAKSVMLTFLAESFAGGRHQRRVDKMNALD